MDLRYLKLHAGPRYNEELPTSTTEHKDTVEPNENVAYIFMDQFQNNPVHANNKSSTVDYIAKM